MYEVRLQEKTLAKLDLVSDPPDSKARYRPDGLTWMVDLYTDIDAVAQRWFAQGKAAGIFIERTTRGCDPLAPRDEDVEWFAERWQPGATSIEHEMCIGHHALEPTPLMRAVMVRLDGLDPIRSTQFRKKFEHPS